MSLSDVPAPAIDWVARMHATVDELARAVADRHGDGLACRRGCAGCCADDLTVFEIEAALIARDHAELLAEGAPHPEGACAFLADDGACRIYASRPYVCRTQGLPLRWLERASEQEGAELYEARDVCPLNLEGVALEALPADALFTLGPIERRLAERQSEVPDVRPDGGRVRLRDLFARRDDARVRLPVLGRGRP